MAFKLVTTLAVVAVPLGAVGGLAVTADRGDAEHRKPPASTTATAPKAATPAGPVSPDRIKPGVVRITGQLGESTVAGSGFIVDARKGLVVTNAHVVDGVTSLKATVGERDQVAARLVAKAPCDDLAVVQLVSPPAGLQALPLASSAAVKTGQHVRAFGFPESLDATRMSVTEGSVSAANVSGEPGGDLPDFPSTIQHQAPINPGNSGGPLVDDAGRVVGINTMGASQLQGTNYAIASDHLRTLLPDLMAGRSRDDVGWTMTQAQNLEFGWQDDPEFFRAGVANDGLGESMYVTDVAAGSPAAQADVRPGDAITSIEGAPVSSFGDVCDAVQSAGKDRPVRLGVVAVDSAGNEPFTTLDPLALKVR